MVEGGLHHLFEQFFVASQFLGIIAGHADDGAFHFWGRVENMFADGKEIFYFIPCLYQYAQDAVGFAARSGSDTFGYFFLYHSGTARDDVLVFQHLEKYLAGDVVRVITGQYERLSVEQPVKVHFQKIVFDNVIFQ